MTPEHTQTCRILLVDDHPSVINGYRFILQSHPQFEVCGTATNEAEALALVAQEKPDVLITDLSMPGMSGLELARKVLEIRPGFPVIVMSGHIRDVDAQRAQALGIGELHWKPNTVEDLAETLRRRLAATKC